MWCVPGTLADAGTRTDEASAAATQPASSRFCLADTDFNRWFRLARELAAERQVNNAHFFQVDLAGPDEIDRPFAAIPLPDASVDLFVNRRGPILRRYLAEALRVARPGAAVVGLHPAGDAPPPSWADLLPEAYRSNFTTWPHAQVTAGVSEPLEAAGIAEYNPMVDRRTRISAHAL